MSLSSMMFPNHSSGSDDSVGEGDPGLEQSMVLLEPGELKAVDEHHCSNVWRLYFGSSCESESGNSPISGLVSVRPDTRVSSILYLSRSCSSSQAHIHTNTEASGAAGHLWFYGPKCSYPIFSFTLFCCPSQSSRCASGQNSMTHDYTGAAAAAAARDPGSSLPPAFMSSLQSGYEELSPEQLERLQQDINNIKNNHRRANVCLYGSVQYPL